MVRQDENAREIQQAAQRVVARLIETGGETQTPKTLENSETNGRKNAGFLSHGVRGDGARVSWDGFLLDGDGFVQIHPPCDGAGCAACDQTGLRRAWEAA